jgi:hypothetical protein
MQITSPDPASSFSEPSLVLSSPQDILCETSPPVVSKGASQEFPSTARSLSPDLTVFGSHSSSIRFILSTGSHTDVDSLPSSSIMGKAYSSRNGKKLMSKLSASNYHMSTPLRKKGPLVDLQRDTFGRKIHVGESQLCQRSPALRRDNKRMTPYRMMLPRSIWHHFEVNSILKSERGVVTGRSKRCYLQHSADEVGSVIINEDLWEDERNPFLLTAFDLIEEPLVSHGPSNDSDTTTDNNSTLLASIPLLSGDEECEFESCAGCCCSDSDMSAGRFMDEWEYCLNVVLKS